MHDGRCSTASHRTPAAALGLTAGDYSYDESQTWGGKAMPDREGHPDTEEMDLGAIFAALADPHRRLVIEELCAESEDTERTCASFPLNLSKSTLTHHFRILRESGLIRQIDYGNSRKVKLRRAELESRFPGLLRLVRLQAVTHA
jgi:DNA-binding transcriptional ArsR family regulator